MFDTSRNIECHIELSNYCNAECPMCGRYTIDKRYPHDLIFREQFNSSQLRLVDIKKIFDDKFFDTHFLQKILMCGNYGDPAAAFDFLQICEYFLEKQPEMHINVATNGGLKTSKMWNNLGKLFSKHEGKSKVTFGIDGLEDTNHIYRQNVDFNKVMENAQAYIDGGGIAEWQFLVFKHNEHQVGEAKELSEKMGFEHFFIMHTARFVYEQKRDGYMVFTHKGKTQILESADTKYGIKRNNHKFLMSGETESIDCWSSRYNSFYIDAAGNLLPCCWLGNSFERMIGWGKDREAKDQVMHLYDTSEMNVIDNDLTDTLQHEFMTEHMPAAWNNQSTCHTCKQFCSKTKNLSKTKQYM